MGREESGLVIPIAGGDERLQVQSLEVACEVEEKLRDRRVIAVAIHRLALEMLSVVGHLILDVHQARVELVVLVVAGNVKVGVRVHLSCLSHQ